MVSLIPRKWDKILPVESRAGQNHVKRTIQYMKMSINTSRADAGLYKVQTFPSDTLPGGIAQLVERQLCKLDVRGSNPLASTNQVFSFQF